MKPNGFHGGVAIDCTGCSGGLALWWKELEVSLQSYSKGHIDVLVREGLGKVASYFTGFYGCPKRENKESSGQLLQCLNHGWNLPWVCRGF